MLPGFAGMAGARSLEIRLVHLSVAIGRFVEALLWAIARAVGIVATGLIAGVVVLVLVFVAGRSLWRRR